MIFSKQSEYALIINKLHLNKTLINVVIDTGTIMRIDRK